MHRSAISIIKKNDWENSLIIFNQKWICGTETFIINESKRLDYIEKKHPIYFTIRIESILYLMNLFDGSWKQFLYTKIFHTLYGRAFLQREISPAIWLTLKIGKFYMPEYIGREKFSPILEFFFTMDEKTSFFL